MSEKSKAQSSKAAEAPASCAREGSIARGEVEGGRGQDLSQEVPPALCHPSHSMSAQMPAAVPGKRKGRPPVWQPTAIESYAMTMVAGADPRFPPSHEEGLPMGSGLPAGMTSHMAAAMAKGSAVATGPALATETGMVYPYATTGAYTELLSHGPAQIYPAADAYSIHKPPVRASTIPLNWSPDEACIANALIANALITSVPLTHHTGLNLPAHHPASDFDHARRIRLPTEPLPALCKRSHLPAASLRDGCHPWTCAPRLTPWRPQPQTYVTHISHHLASCTLCHTLHHRTQLQLFVTLHLAFGSYAHLTAEDYWPTTAQREYCGRRIASTRHRMPPT